MRNCQRTACAAMTVVLLTFVAIVEGLPVVDTDDVTGHSDADQPRLPEEYSAIIKQIHYDADSHSSRSRVFRVYQDFDLSRQRLDEDIFYQRESKGRTKSRISISEYGQTWGDKCGGKQALVEDFFSRQVCYKADIPDSVCISEHDFPPAPGHPISTYKFKKSGSKVVNGILCDIWIAHKPRTACKNIALLGTRHGSLMDLVFYNVSSDCSRWDHTFDVFNISRPDSDLFKLNLTEQCKPLSDLDEMINSKERIERINQAALNAGWIAGANTRFDGFVAARMQELTGTYKRTSVGHHSRLETRQPILDQSVDLPQEFDARERWPQCKDLIGHVRDQGSCGSCWAFAATEALSDRFCIASGVNATSDILSPEYLLSCSKENDGCDGGYVDVAWEFFKDHGTDRDVCTPYKGIDLGHCPRRCSRKSSRTKPEMFKVDTAYTPGTSAVDIQLEIFNNGPVEAAFFVYSDFMNYKSGVYRQTSKVLVGGHAVKIIGWGQTTEAQATKGRSPSNTTVPYWLIANSWGTTWGEQGLFRMIRGQNECGIEDEVGAGTPAKRSKVPELYDLFSLVEI